MLQNEIKIFRKKKNKCKRLLFKQIKCKRNDIAFILTGIIFTSLFKKCFPKTFLLVILKVFLHAFIFRNKENYGTRVHLTLLFLNLVFYVIVDFNFKNILYSFCVKILYFATLKKNVNF